MCKWKTKKKSIEVNYVQLSNISLNKELGLYNVTHSQEDDSNLKR